MFFVLLHKLLLITCNYSKVLQKFLHCNKLDDVNWSCLCFAFQFCVHKETLHSLLCGTQSTVRFIYFVSFELKFWPCFMHLNKCGITVFFCFLVAETFQLICMHCLENLHLKDRIYLYNCTKKVFQIAHALSNKLPFSGKIQKYKVKNRKGLK